MGKGFSWDDPLHMPATTRQHLTLAVEAQGGVVHYTLTSNVHFLVSWGPATSTSLRQRQATRLGIPIVRAEFLHECRRAGRLVEPGPYLVSKAEAQAQVFKPVGEAGMAVSRRSTWGAAGERQRAHQKATGSGACAPWILDRQRHGGRCGQGQGRGGGAHGSTWQISAWRSEEQRAAEGRAEGSRHVQSSAEHSNAERRGAVQSGAE